MTSPAFSLLLLFFSFFQNWDPGITGQGVINGHCIIATGRRRREMMEK
jgi:hypothetical protein